MLCLTQYTLDRRKPEENLTSPMISSVSGMNRVKSSVYEHKVDIVDMISVPCLEPQNQSKESMSVMQESRPLLKRKIWKDRLNSSELSTLTMQLSKTLEAVSISKEKVLRPFWTSHLEDSYKSLWLPIKTDSCDLALSSLPKSYGMEMGKSWFSIERKGKPQSKSSAQTLLPSLQFLRPEFTVSEVGKTERPSK